MVTGTTLMVVESFTGVGRGILPGQGSLDSKKDWNAKKVTSVEIKYRRVAGW